MVLVVEKLIQYNPTTAVLKKKYLKKKREGLVTDLNYPLVIGHDLSEPGRSFGGHHRLVDFLVYLSYLFLGGDQSRR